MHTLLSVSIVVAVLGAGWLALGLERRLANSAQQQQLLLSVLLAPVLGLAVTAGALWHLAGQTCFLGAPPWDDVVGSAVPLGMGLLALGGLGLAVLRSVLLVQLVAHGTSAGDEVQTRAEVLAARLGVRPPTVRVLGSARPLAFIFGLRQPMIVLSAWMLRDLDDREREAVLAHELAHAWRGDYHWVFAATMLRDAFFYVPASQIALQRLKDQSELACDDLAVALTERPLALAGALAKIWREAADRRPIPVAAPGVAEIGPQIEVRIQRLLDGASPSGLAAQPPGSLPVVIGGSLVTLGGLPLVSALLLFVPMGCGPFVRMLG